MESIVVIRCITIKIATLNTITSPKLFVKVIKIVSAPSSTHPERVSRSPKKNAPRTKIVTTPANGRMPFTSAGDGNMVMLTTNKQYDVSNRK